MNQSKCLLCAWVLVGALGLCLLSPTAAETWPDPKPPLIGKGGENDVALIVAIENYPEIPPVLGARRNGEAWERYFKDTLGVRDVIILIDKDAPHYTIRRELEAAANRVKGEGRLWFVFIGHGAPANDGKDGLLVGSKADATADGIYQNSLPRAEVLEVIQQAGVPAVLVLDACFSGAYGDAKEAIAKGLQPLVPVHVDSALGQVLVLSAGKADQLAGPLPGDDRPAFSYLLVRALSGEGDLDLDGRVTAVEGVAFVSKEMRRVALGRRQEPQLDPGAHGDWLLTPQADPAQGCPTGQTRSADTDGQCCWPGQSWIRSRGQCIGEPSHCPPGLGKLANACGPCPTGDTLQGDSCRASADATQTSCPEGAIMPDGSCAEDQQSPKVPSSAQSSSQSVWGWVTAGVGVALIGAGIGTYAYASSLATELEGSGLTQAEAANKDSQISIMNTLTITGFSIGGAALATGVILLLTDHAEAASSVQVQIGTDHVVLGFGSSF